VDNNKTLQFFDLGFWVGCFIFSFNLEMEGCLVLRPCSDITEYLTE